MVPLGEAVPDTPDPFAEPHTSLEEDQQPTGTNGTPVTGTGRFPRNARHNGIDYFHNGYGSATTPAWEVIVRRDGRVTVVSRQFDQALRAETHQRSFALPRTTGIGEEPRVEHPIGSLQEWAKQSQSPQFGTIAAYAADILRQIEEALANLRDYHEYQRMPTHAAADRR